MSDSPEHFKKESLMSSDTQKIIIYLIVIALFVVAVFVFAPPASEAQRVLENQGYSNVVMSGVKLGFWYCGDSDIYRFDVISATNPAGQPLTVPTYVCKGFFKGYTVRSY